MNLAILINCQGEIAKPSFERARLPNEVLGRIWSLADSEQKGELSLTEFIIAMHLISSYREGSLRALPQILPAGLYEAASRRGAPRQFTGSRPPSGVSGPSPISRHFSGSGVQASASPALRPINQTSQLSSNHPLEGWAINSRDKETFDEIFSTVDKANRGYITGDQAVGFFSNSKLSEEALAQIWDLADINSEGRLSRDEFAVAMFLIRQQRMQRDVLPRTLPPNLIPPSMRQQTRAPTQPIVPVFDTAINTTASKSAVEDLFGLDSWTTPAPQIPQSTGDSALRSSTPPIGRGSPQQSSQPLQAHSSSTFKPFVPSSSFGQSMINPPATGLSPQSTGFSNRSSPAQSKTIQPKTVADDLLGDNDPEISQKLTQETTELANLSNQVSSLTTQMQEVKSKRISTEQDISKAQLRKRDFEGRLSQLRSAYEQEVTSVKALDERLASLRNEIKKLEQESALIGGTYQDLQNQHRQLAEAFELDRVENANLKERIRQTNLEIGELKPQLENIKSEARQCKGLVAINKKQLATNEGEREKLKDELEGISREVESAKQEVEESTRKLETKPDAHTPAVTSPASQTSTMNPFFRQSPPGSSEKSMSAPRLAQNVASPNHDAFDNFFGPPLDSSQTPTSAPITSFMLDPSTRQDDMNRLRLASTQSVRSSEGPDLPTPSDSPPSIYNDMAQFTKEPPAPPQSRQITSNFLPMRNLDRSDSTSSSVKVAPPASRGGLSGFDTPTEEQPSLSAAPAPEMLKQQLDEVNLSSRDDSLQPFIPEAQESPATQSQNTETNCSDDNVARKNNQASTLSIVPGAFSDESPPSTQAPPAKSTLPQSASSTEPSPFGASSPYPHSPFTMVKENPKDPEGSKHDFDAAFENFGNKGKAPERINGSSTASNFGGLGQPKSQGEFPPIQDVAGDDESDTESDHGFDDNFTAISPRRQPVALNRNQHEESSLGDHSMTLAPSRPSLQTERSDLSQLPTPGAQMSPPTYDQTVAPNGQSDKRRDSNQFPSEYIGLLPSREILNTPPISSPVNDGPEKAGSSTVNSKGLGIFGRPIMEEPTSGSKMPSVPLPLAPGASVAPYAYDNTLAKVNQPQPPIPAKIGAAVADFDNEFGDLAEAKEADDKADDEFGSTRKDEFDDFNPVFDPPASTNPSGSKIPAGNGFHDFETSVASSSPGPKNQLANQAPPKHNHDWDAMFAGLDTSPSNGAQASSTPGRTLSSDLSQPQANRYAPGQAKPTLPRGLSTGTDHDDPILRRLTGIGYSREASLKALEKFDYNIDKASLRVH